MTELTDEKLNFLFDEFRRGNERAFDYIFKQYYKPLCQFSFSFVKEENIAENLVQDVFIKLWEKRGSLSGVSNLSSYLMGMVRNQSIDYLRKEESTLKIYKKLSSPVPVNTTDDQILKNEFEERLLQSIMKLPDRCRTAIEMSRFEGFSNKEIAQQMQISVKGVEALIGRSLKMLRVEMREFLPSFKKKKKNGPTTLLAILLKRLNFC